MLCALTVRKLKPGTMEDFKRAFIPDDVSDVPSGWKQFYALRNFNDENEVITFGLFDGTLEELRAGQEGGEYDQRRSAADEYVESVGADGIYEVVEHRSMG
jgi:hypothetical protein